MICSKDIIDNEFNIIAKLEKIPILKYQSCHGQMAVLENNGLLHQSIFDFEHAGWHHHALSLDAKQCFIRPTFDNILDGRFSPANAKLDCGIGIFQAVCLDSIVDSLFRLECV
jgi:hypothetical protein